MVIIVANVRSTIYIINIYNILSVCVCVCLHYGWKNGKLGTEKVGLSVFSGYLFFCCCFPSLSLVLCKYLCNYALYL